MSQKEMAEFTVRIFSAEHATWQGEAESGGETARFESEMELLNWVLKKWPELVPRLPDSEVWLKTAELTVRNDQKIKQGGSKE